LPKGCAIIYDEIEDISRTIIKKTKKKKMWRKLKPGEKASKLDLDNGAWEKVLELFQSFYIVNKNKVADLTANLIHRIAASTAYRNESAHKPKTPEERTQRDREMRTRFESAADLLLDLLKVLDQLKA
jgi:molecular chaperone GrpE (heat shock protein)